MPVAVENGNRLLKPEKTIQYEVGIERNFFDLFLLTVSGYYKDIRNTIRDIIVDTPQGVYHTTGNGNYGDVKGFEISLRKQYARADWGTTSGYMNFNSQIRVYGLSGDPVGYSYQTGTTFANSGDASTFERADVLTDGSANRNPHDLREIVDRITGE